MLDSLLSKHHSDNESDRDTLLKSCCLALAVIQFIHSVLNDTSIGLFIFGMSYAEEVNDTLLDK